MPPTSRADDCASGARAPAVLICRVEGGFAARFAGVSLSLGWLIVGSLKKCCLAATTALAIRNRHPGAMTLKYAWPVIGILASRLASDDLEFCRAVYARRAPHVSR